MTARPTFTVAAAATATGKSRRTIGRMLDADELPGATRDDSGTWSIPADALLAAGLQLHAPSPPDPVESARGPETTHPESARGSDADEVAQLRAEVADLRRRAEVAEAIADERAAALADVRQALDLATRMLPASTTPTEFPNAVAGDFPDREGERAPTEVPRRRRWLRR